MTPGEYNIQTTVGDNTLEEIVITLTDGDDAPINLTGADIIWTVRTSKSSPVLLTKSVGSGITLSDPTAGEFTLNQILNIDLPPGDFLHEFRIVFASGIRKTYIRGTFTVLYTLTA